MQFLCDAWDRVKNWWSPASEKPCLLEPLNPRVTIMDPPPTLKQLEQQISRKNAAELEKVVYFYKPKNKLP